jgi:hypothetical protein
VFFTFECQCGNQYIHTGDVMNNEGGVSFDFIFYWVLIQARKDIEKVVYVKSNAHVYRIIQIIIVIIMTKEQYAVNETYNIVCHCGVFVFCDLGRNCMPKAYKGWNIAEVHNIYDR